MSDRSDDGAGRLPRILCARRSGVCVAAMLAVVGLLFVWQSSLLDLGHIGLPGPGFFPLVLGGVVAAFSTLIGIERWRTPANGETVALGHRDVLIVLAALAFPLVFDPARRLSHARPVWRGGAGAHRAGFACSRSRRARPVAACWYFFQVLLGLQLPDRPF